MDMGQKIKRIRKEKGMTLEELGNKVGVGKSTVRKWENGIIANMRRDKIAKIADALGCSPSYLMGWTESLETVNTCDLLETCHDLKAFEMVNLFTKLDDVDRAKVIERINTLLESEKYSTKDRFKNA